MTTKSIFALSGRDWHTTTCAMSGTEPACSPPLSAATRPGRKQIGAILKKAARRQVFYLNLHGYYDKPYYCGMSTQPGHTPEIVRPIVLTPELIAKHHWQNTIIYAEVCYSAANTPGNRAMVKAFLNNGCRAFVGSTTQAWGRIKPVGLLSFDGEADRLGAYFLRGLARRPDNPGRALAFAKRYLRFMSALNGLDADDIATLNGFVVLER